MSLKNLINSIIGNHNLKQVEDHELKPIVSNLDKNENSHLGNFYQNSGMKINLDNKNDPATNSLISLMDFIKKNWDSSDSESGLKRQKDNKTTITQEKSTESDQAKSRSIDSIDLPEETIIKALAVSILAETDGDCNLAKEVLNIGGLKMIKAMSPRALNKLTAELKSISAQIEN